VSTLLYHALTTGAGAQTLGEEYCDLLQISGKPFFWWRFHRSFTSQRVMSDTDNLALSARPVSTHCAILLYSVTSRQSLIPGSISGSSMNVAGTVPVEPSSARRAVLVLGQTVIPYCIEWLSRTLPATRVNSDNDDAQSFRSQPQSSSTPAVDAPLPHERLLSQVRVFRMFACICMPRCPR
jgi:hypothetical protein